MNKLLSITSIMVFSALLLAMNIPDAASDNPNPQSENPVTQPKGIITLEGDASANNPGDLEMVLPLSANTIYYVDYKLSDDCVGNYSIANRSCTGADGIAFNTLHEANLAVAAGDTVYIRGGTADYETIAVGDFDSPSEGIHPAASGTDANHKITYATYQNEKVNFVGGDNLRSRGIFIEDKNWIKVTGYDGSTSAMNMKFSNMAEYLFIWDGDYDLPYGVGSSYNEIEYCEFSSGNTYSFDADIYRGSTIFHNSSYNWIHHCSFHDFGGYDVDGNDVGTTLEIGYEESEPGSEPDSTSNNVIENCTFYHAGHHVIGVHRKYNIIRNNILHNEQWFKASDGYWHGYRLMYMGGDYEENHGYNLVEGNRISHGSENINESNGHGIDLAQSNDIIRYNDFYATNLTAIFMESSNGFDHERCNSNHIYNNTLFANGYSATFPDIANPPRTDTWDRRTVFLSSGPTTNDWTYMMNNVIKNNLFWKNYGGPEGELQIITQMYNNGRDFDDCVGYTSCGNTEYTPNWVDTDGNPKFSSEGSYGSPQIHNTNVEWYWPSPPNGSDITKINTEPIFNLQSSSPVINQGTYLTWATNNATSPTTTLVVNDPGYFQTGWGNWGEAGGGPSVEADWIAIGTVSNTVQIESIDYASKTITLASPMAWSNGDHIWLYKNSKGEVVLYETAPDYGAHEYASVQLVYLPLVLKN